MEELYKKGLNDLENHNSVVTHLEPYILECEVKSRALGSIIRNKANGGIGISAGLFQILEDDSVKVMPSVCQQIWKTQQWPQDWKRSVFILIPKKGKANECSNCHTIAQISHVSKLTLRILQPRLQQYISQEIPAVQTGFIKGRGARDQIANIHWIIAKARELKKKKVYFCFTGHIKILTVWVTTHCGKLLKKWDYQTTLPVCVKLICKSRSYS